MGLMTASHPCRTQERPPNSSDTDAVRAHAAVLVKATLTSVIAMSAAAVDATAPASGAALPDIVGLRPGIPAQQAYDFLKAYDRTGRVDVGDIPLGALGAPPISPKPFPYLLTLGQDQNIEVISVSLTLPPLKATVWRVSRNTHFGAGQEPTVEKVIDSLRAKYGPEAVLIAPDNMPSNSTLAWYFDETGRQVERPGGLDPHACVGRLGPTNVDLLQPLDDREGVRECRAVVVVAAQMEHPVGTANFRVVGQLRVTVADLPLEARAHAATLALIAKGSAAEAQQEKQREDQVAAPKL